jgi:MATE family multidrug resistance protein
LTLQTTTTDSGLAADPRTAGSYRQVWTLAYPAILTMISQTVMWTVDSAMVGHVGKTELAAVGLGGILVFTLYSFFIGLTSAVNTFVAQSSGAEDYRRCGTYLRQGLYISIAAAAAIYAVRALSPQIVDLLRPDEPVRPLTLSYVQIRMLSAPFFLVYYTFSHFYRGIGDTRTPLKVLLVAQAVNLAADYLLIFGQGPFPAMGVEGAAWATTMANVVAAAIFLALAGARKMRRQYGAFDRLRPDWAEIARLLRIGLPIAVHFFLDMGSFLVFSAYIGRMGTEALAVNQIAIQILALSFMPCQGFAIAATTLMGQYIGAGRPELAMKSAYTTLKFGLVYAGFIAALCLAIPEQLVRIFNGDPLVVELGRPVLYWAALFQAFDAIQFISDGALRGAGDTRVPMLIVVGAAWLVFLPLAYAFGTVLDQGVVGAWAGATLYIVVIGIAMFARLKTGRWRRVRI